MTVPAPQSAARITGLLVGVLLALLASPGARAGARMEVNALEYPWSAIGRLNAAGQSYCSGVLVGERLVLTAAHCLYNRRERRWWPASALHFVAGYQRGAFPIHSPVKTVVRADGYRFADHPAPAAEADDWAVLELAEPIGRAAGWLGLEAMTAETLLRLRRERAPVVLAGYRADHSQILTLDRTCALLGFLADTPLLAHDCEAMQGESGGPLLAFEQGEARVIGIHVIAMATRDRTLGGAVATTVLADDRRWPEATAAVARWGLRPPTGNGQPPAPGSPAAALPSRTIATLLQVPPTSSPATAITTYQTSHGLPATGRASVDLLGRLLAR